MKTIGYVAVLLLMFAVSKNAFCQIKIKPDKTRPDTVRLGDHLLNKPSFKADSDSLDMNLKPSSPTLPSPNNPNPHHPQPNPVNPNRPVVPDTTANPVPGGPIKPAEPAKK